MQSPLNVVARNGEETPVERPTRYEITAEDQRRLEQAFMHHPPKGDQPERYHAIRQEGLLLALRIVQAAPPGRERSLALTNLEQAVMWANAAIARGE